MDRPSSATRAAAMLGLYEAVRSPKKVADYYGVSEQTVCYWLPYLGLNAKWLRHVRKIEEQNRRLLQSIKLHKSHLRIATALIKQLQTSPKKRSLIATAAVAKFAIPRSVANRIVGLSEHAAEFHHAMRLDRILVDAMRTHLALHPGRGFAGMYSAFLRHEPGTRERALRLYTEHLLRTNRARRRKGVAKVRKHLPRQGTRDAMWSMDFMQDALVNGQPYWLLNVTDDFSREAISTLVLTRRSAKAVVEHLESLKVCGRKPTAIRTDNGGEFRSVTYQEWARKRDVVCEFIRPGRPTDNAFIERFNSTVRREVLGRIEFKTMKQVQRALDDWRLTYNYARPHQSLGNLSPLQYQHAHGLLRAR